MTFATVSLKSQDWLWNSWSLLESTKVKQAGSRYGGKYFFILFSPTLRKLSSFCQASNVTSNTNIWITTILTKTKWEIKFRNLSEFESSKNSSCIGNTNWHFWRADPIGFVACYACLKNCKGALLLTMGVKQRL